jgi:hypothetical protein
MRLQYGIHTPVTKLTNLTKSNAEQHVLSATITETKPQDASLLHNRKPVPFLYGTWEEGLFVCGYIGVMLYQSVGTSGSGVTRRLDHIYDDSGIQTKPCITLYIIMSLWLFRCSVRGSHPNDFTTMVQPTLEYASAAWDPYASDQINKFDKVQRRAARFVSNNYRDKTPGCVTAMVKSLGCEPLTEHRKSHKLKLAPWQTCCNHENCGAWILMSWRL